MEGKRKGWEVGREGDFFVNMIGESGVGGF